jgi:drug/metabolite transporter (DMT)-like permease
MSAGILARLLLLGAIWGSSFLFMRITVPALGVGVTAAGRLALAALAVLLLLRALGRPLQWRARWRDYLVVGLLASGLPFLLYAFAARYLPAGYSAVLNSTVPLFAVLLTWAATRLPPSQSKLLGVALGVAGVAALARYGNLDFTPGTLAGFAACLSAALMYAVAAQEIRRRFAGADPLTVAGGSMLAAALVLSPAVAWDAPATLPDAGPLLALAALALLCTGVANVIYFGLVRDAGAERATTVTFLMPVFAQVWGAAFLDEPLTIAVAVGCALILIAVALVFEKVPSWQRIAAVVRDNIELFAPQEIESVRLRPCSKK